MEGAKKKKRGLVFIPARRKSRVKKKKRERKEKGKKRKEGKRKKGLSFFLS